jgi:hypothetical protein
MKSGVAAFMAAGKALKQSGVDLKGDCILAAVAGEISRTLIGPYQSASYRGEGTGTRRPPLSCFLADKRTFMLVNVFFQPKTSSAVNASSFGGAGGILSGALFAILLLRTADVANGFPPSYA